MNSVMFFREVVFLLCLSLSGTVTVLKWPRFDCSRQYLECKVSTSNCMDREWVKSHKYTPSCPENLKVSMATRRDEMGNLHPVLNATWEIKDDGSISFLTATELHVLVKPTNQNICVRYSFKNQLPMRDPSGKKWSFSADMMVLDPGIPYKVSVSNIPKPENDHSHCDVSHDVTVPDCDDPIMQMTKFCIERGSLWHPNISLAMTPVNGKSALAVSFIPDRLCEEYYVIVKCSDKSEYKHIYKANQTSLYVTFSLNQWPRTCCQFEAQIKPIFPQCGQDCTRQIQYLNNCFLPAKPTRPPDVFPYIFIIPGLVYCLVVIVIIYVLYRKTGKMKVPEKTPTHGVLPPQHLEQHPKVLIIYSQDHKLYRDIVLKLCAFLQVKCGTKVLVDLLDSTSVGMVGRLRWLEWQRQQLKNPTDKILVLCSKGVQAKWRALCGQGQVTLREDVLSPTDDMITPFLHLFLPDMHQAGMLGKYMVAYFDDISSDQDIPSVFDITVKYKLMKHFEELFFRIIDVEKYQPDKVNHINGIGGDEYFNCPSGSDLRNAIETFRAYQLDNPDWFEKECVGCEEEVMTETKQLIDQLQIPPVLECFPLIREGPPVYTHEVEITENANSVHVLTPELNPQNSLSVGEVVDFTPAVNHECKHQYLLDLDEVLTSHLYPQSPSPQSVYIAEPVLNMSPSLSQTWCSVERPTGPTATENDEEDSLLFSSHIYSHLDPRGLTVQNSLSDPSESSYAYMQSEYLPPSEISCSMPVEMEDREILESNEKGPNSGSDQGYISRVSSQPEPHFKDDPLVSLAKLQEQLFQQNLMYPDMHLEGN